MEILQAPSCCVRKTARESLTGDLAVSYSAKNFCFLKSSGTIFTQPPRLVVGAQLTGNISDLHEFSSCTCHLHISVFYTKHVIFATDC